MILGLRLIAFENSVEREDSPDEKTFTCPFRKNENVSCWHTRPSGGISINDMLIGRISIEGSLRKDEAAEYIENKATVRSRQRNSVFQIDCTYGCGPEARRLNPQLYTEVREVLEVNKAQRHIRGGLATREKYKNL